MSKNDRKGAFAVCPKCKKATSVPKKEENIMRWTGRAIAVGGLMSVNLPAMAVGACMLAAGEAVDSMMKEKIKCAHCQTKIEVTWL